MPRLEMAAEGLTMPNQDALCDAIKTVLNELPLENTYDRAKFWPSEWTARIKAAIAELGYERHYSVWGSGLTEKEDATTGGRIVNQEWMFDLAWINYSGHGLTRSMNSLPLAMESELPLGPKHVKEEKVLDDFEKLVISHAALKVMVFQVDKISQAENQFRRLERHAQAFDSQNPASSYLLAALVWGTKPSFHSTTFHHSNG